MTEVAAPSIILVPADLASVAVVRTAVGQSLADRNWDDDDITRVVLATSEATANAVEHGSTDGDLIEVLYHVGAFETSVRVLDAGGPLAWEPPATITAPDPSAPRGRGLLLMRSLAEQLTVASSGPGVEVRMEFDRNL